MSWFGFLLILHVLAATVCVGQLLLQSKRPIGQIAWALTIVLLPGLGVLAYQLIGSDRLRLRRLRARLSQSDEEAEACGFSLPPEAVVDPPTDPLWRGLSRISHAPTTVGNSAELHDRVDDYYDRLRRAIDGAQRQIWIAFYVWRPDETGRAFLQQLIAAAERGVEVRLLTDEIGSGRTPESFFRPLIAAGGTFSWTMTLFPRRNRWFINLRNHRKLVIVDGGMAMVGGMNIGDEYLYGFKGMTWHDLHLTLHGPVIRQLAAVFADDWYFAQAEQLALVPHEATRPQETGIPIQLIRGGPDQVLSGIGLATLAQINSARHRLICSTPFFIPDEPLLIAFELAAARGVAVTLLVSADTDLGRLSELSRTFYDRLLATGVTIYEYPRDIHHGKCMLIDDDLVQIGSINLDVRSLYLNYEVGVLLADADMYQQVYDGLFAHLADARPISREELREHGLWRRLRQGVLRMLSPLL